VTVPTASVAATGVCERGQAVLPNLHEAFLFAQAGGQVLMQTASILRIGVCRFCQLLGSAWRTGSRAAALVERWLWRDRMPLLGILLSIVIVILICLGHCPAVEGFCLIAGPLFSWIAERGRRRTASEASAASAGTAGSDWAEAQAADETRANEIAAIRGSGGATWGGSSGGSWYRGLQDGARRLGEIFGERKGDQS
jgi:hypothetical protein